MIISMPWHDHIKTGDAVLMYVLVAAGAASADNPFPTVAQSPDVRRQENKKHVQFKFL